MNALFPVRNAQLVVDEDAMGLLFAWRPRDACAGGPHAGPVVNVRLGGAYLFMPISRSSGTNIHVVGDLVGEHIYL
jgi:hypothetical protein